MSGLVVDASVGLKWYADEVHAAVARLLLNGKEELSVPHLFFTEIGNALWKRWRRREISASAGKGSLIGQGGGCSVLSLPGSWFFPGSKAPA